jgi:hypothetical protein
VYTVDELEDHPPVSRDMGRAEVVDPPSASSRTESVRGKLAAKRGATPAAEKMPNVDEIINAINAATNQHELAKAIEPASKLASDEDKERVRATYAAKIAAAKAEAQRSATKNEPPAITYDDLVARFNATNDVDMLDADATLIGQLPAERQQDAIEAYNNRREVLLGA